jgi:energy-coupling factor transporter ATP-binding protein EcfA2
MMATPGATLQTMPTATPLSAESHPIKIVPKGLRSFDAHDADFFLELLPGARDREGLPDSIRFWKNGIEELDADHTFPVGLIYGPSGCGKSSLVKAGLLPRLSTNVIAIYVEATAEETETRLLNGLRKCCSELPIDLTLIETFAFLRRGQGITSGKKIIVFLDQFEQWLHAKKDDENTELSQALRQCDGGRIQCIVMVRDDFWMSATRFMRELEVRLLEGQNSSAVDLFPIRHAENVLAAFGRAFGILPAKTTDTSNEQLAFVKQGVAGLAQEGKVISVRLSLFAEMMKGKSWTPASLKSVGGAEGVGVAFLEETFSAAIAPPEHRYHQEAARAVLKLLLPESGTDIKGHMRSHRELLEASGYENRPQDFHDLIRILDREIRLITPTDPDGLHDSSSNRRATSPKANATGIGEVEVPVDESTRLPEITRYYQLSHDYLVPSLREWLTRKQGETRRGRAELLLADRAAVWSARLENRQLPSLWQWLKIRLWTPRKHWTISQQKMMSKASRRHLVRGGIASVFIASLAWFGYEMNGYDMARILRDRLLVADTAEVPRIIKEMRSVRRWSSTLLKDAAVERETNTWHSAFSVVNGDYSPESADYAKRILQLDPRKKLHISLALLPDDVSQVKPLYHRLLNAEPNEVAVIRDALAPYKVDLIEDLWKVMESKNREQAPQRLHAAAALALYDPSNEKWEAIRVEVADELVNVPAVYLATWLDALRPIRKTLLAPVLDIYRNVSRRELERALATDILKAYASDDPNVLAELFKDASNP